VLTVVRSCFAIMALANPPKATKYAKFRFITWILLSVAAVVLYLADLFMKSIDDTIIIDFTIVILVAIAGIAGILFDFHFTRVVDFYAKANFIVPNIPPEN